MLKVKNISFARNKRIINKLSFSLKKGTYFGIVGPSGEGKSTLLKIIAGLLDADSGKVLLSNQEIIGPKDKLIPGNSNIQLVNQDFEIDEFHTVYDNLKLKTTHLESEIRENYIAELLELTELNHLRNQRANLLSGGEQQRLALARALALEPEVLLLDEPFSHLDAHIKRKISNYLIQLKKVRKTILIIVSHDGQEILHLSDQIAFFKSETFKRVDSPENFYKNPASYEEGLFFGELNRIQIKSKKYIFRPNQYLLQEGENTLELNVSFKKEIFFGAFTLGLFQYKTQQIYLTNKGEDFSEINTIHIFES